MSTEPHAEDSAATGDNPEHPGAESCPFELPAVPADGLPAVPPGLPRAPQAWEPTVPVEVAPKEHDEGEE